MIKHSAQTIFPTDLIKNDPENISKSIIINLNINWSRGEYPDSLKNVIINLMIKPGKNPTETSVQIICRIPCIGKIHENITKR